MNKKILMAEFDAALIKALVKDSGKSYRCLADQFGIGINYLIGVVQRNGLSRKRGRGSPAWPAKKPEAI